MPSKGEGRYQVWLAVVCAALGFLIIPAGIAIGLGAYLVISGYRKRKRSRVFGGCLAVVLAVLTACPALWGIEDWAYRWRRGNHVVLLATAVTVYNQYEGPLPATIEELEASGLFGTGPYRTPMNSWEDSPSGPRPFYLPAKTEGLIVAVEARTPRTPVERGYVILGDMSAHYARDEELRKLLVADDETRRSAGEPGRWASIPWDARPE